MHPGDALLVRHLLADRAGGRCIRRVIDPLGGLRIRHILATGRSQSAFRLVTYINAVHRQAALFQRLSRSQPRRNACGSDGRAAVAAIRRRFRPARTSAPTSTCRCSIVQTEGDMVTLRAHLTHQPPSARYRRWEIAGAAHAESPRWVAEVPPPLDMGQGCKDPINSAPHHAVVKAGAARADALGPRRRRRQPQSPAIELADPRCRRSDRARCASATPRAASGCRKSKRRLRRSTDGATTSLRRRPARRTSVSCSATPCRSSHRRWRRLYPTHDAFVKKFTAAVDALERDGYWLKPEADQARKAAADSRVGR